MDKPALGVEYNIADLEPDQKLDPPPHTYTRKLYAPGAYDYSVGWTLDFVYIFFVVILLHMLQKQRYLEILIWINYLIYHIEQYSALF